MKKDRNEDGAITFYAAECMEFTSFGELHTNLTLEEAVKRYNAIPAKRLNAIKGIGFVLEDGSIYSGMEWGLLVGGQIDYDNLELVQHYKESPLVQEAVKKLEAMKETLINS